MNKVMSYMMMSEMMKGNTVNGVTTANSGMANFLPMMMLGSGVNMFENMFDFDDDEEDSDENEYDENDEDED